MFRFYCFFVSFSRKTSDRYFCFYRKDHYTGEIYHIDRANHKIRRSIRFLIWESYFIIVTFLGGVGVVNRYGGDFVMVACFVRSQLDRISFDHDNLVFKVMFKTRAAVFYRDLKPRGAAERF